MRFHRQKNVKKFKNNLKDMKLHLPELEESLTDLEKLSESSKSSA